jgi:3',5'-cyclic AMP phosphodiesterase CpdA
VEWGDTESSAILSFATADAKADSLTCIFFNDIHDRLPVFNTLVQHVAELHPDMSVFNGDCFNDPREESRTLMLLENYNRGINASTTPGVYLRGNHEIRGAYSRQWPSLVSNPGGMQYFSMGRGPIRFVFMDCGEDKLDNHWAYSGLNDFEGFHREQAAWLEKEIETPEFKNAKYRVLAHHIPIYGLSAKAYNPWKTIWGSILNRAGFDISFHGHTHRATIHPPHTAGNHTYPVVIGGGPTLENGTVTILKANDKELNVEILDTQGKGVATYQVQRKWRV